MSTARGARAATRSARRPAVSSGAVIRTDNATEATLRHLEELSQRMARMEQHILQPAAVVDPGVAPRYVAASIPAAQSPAHPDPVPQAVQPEIPALELASQVSGELADFNQLDDHVNDLCKQKIREEAFVDFALLIPKADGSVMAQGQHMFLLEVEGNLALGQKELVESKQNLTYNQWSQAWAVFASIYLRDYPDQAIPLIKYADTIRKLFSRGMDWRRYDVSFRRARAACPLRYRWESVNAEMFLLAQKSEVGQPFRGASSGDRANTVANTPRLFVPAGYCRRFHRPGDRCTSIRCTFKHECWKCGVSHSAGVTPCRTAGRGTRIGAAERTEAKPAARGAGRGRQ